MVEAADIPWIEGNGSTCTSLLNTEVVIAVDGVKVDCTERICLRYAKFNTAIDRLG